MSRRAKKTEWFDGSVKPVHVGVYQRRIDGLNREGNYAYWNGEFWGAFVGMLDSPDNAFKMRDCRTRYHDLPWRGLAKKPKSNNNQGE